MRRSELPQIAETPPETERFLGGQPDVITIDGQVGAGKGTAARIFSERFGYRHLEAGSLFRAAAIAAIDAGVSVEDEAALLGLIESLEVETVDEYGLSRTVVNGVDVTDLIKAPGVGELSTQISLDEHVSASLIAKIVDFANRGNAIIDGRGVGTEEAPGAGLKLYLIADLDVRSGRRHRQYERFGMEELPTLEEVVAEVHRRDVAERNRAYAPNLPAADAIIIDTESHTPDQVVDVAVAAYNARVMAARTGSFAGRVM